MRPTRSQAGFSYEVDPSFFPNRRALDDYLSVFEKVAKGGGIVLTPGRGRHRNDPPRIRLGEPLALYAYLSRAPSRAVADEALATLFERPLPGWAVSTLEEIRGAWSRSRDWYGVPVGDGACVERVFALALAVLKDRHVGHDYRSLSVAIADRGESFLEKHEPAVVRALSYARQLPVGHPRAVLSAIGLDQIALPFHLSGPITLFGQVVPLRLCPISLFRTKA